MVIVSAIADVRDAVATARAAGARIGFVPTMGALHKGHMSLVTRAQREADVTVMSIFVNPLQFAPHEDLSRYPRPYEEDEGLAREGGVDILFRPETEEMYPGDRVITVSAGELGAEWEGRSRPGHFDGVLTVVAKLFNIVQADFAVFGRKDLQQAALVRALVRDLDIPTKIVLSPIVREEDGLALSSRNRFLVPDDRARATLLNRSLIAVRESFAQGVRDTDALEAAGLDVLRSDPGVAPDYLAVIDPGTFTRAAEATEGFSVIVAARIGSTRLIDNMPLAGDDQD